MAGLSTEETRSQNESFLQEAHGVSPEIKSSKTNDTSETVGETTPAWQALSCVNNTYGEGDERNKFITYTVNKLKENGFNNWMDIVTTWQHEGDWQPEAYNGANSNGTFDKGICQLNSAYHSNYINSPEFQDPYNQIDYCMSVAMDARNKGRHLSTVWYGWASRGKHKHKIECK